MISNVMRLQLRLGAPVAVVALEHDAGVELVLDQLVRAGADRLVAELSTPTYSM